MPKKASALLLGPLAIAIALAISAGGKEHVRILPPAALTNVETEPAASSATVTAPTTAPVATIAAGVTPTEIRSTSRCGPRAARDRPNARPLAYGARKN